MGDALVAVNEAKKKEAEKKAQMVAKLEKEQAANNLLFDSKLSKAPVGELFAMADEYKVKGDYAHAKQALRKLLERFPDHKLAIPSASMLSELQGK